MIEKILDIAKMVLAILPFVLLCFASKKVNLPKVERSKQFLMPVFTLIYVIVVVFSINKLNTWLIGLIQAIPGWIEELGYATWMPESIGSLISKLAVLVEEFIQSLNLNYWVCYLSNAVILIIYMLYKRIIITLLSWIIKTDGKLHKAVSGCFYEYFIEKNKWCIREDYVQVRSMFKTFYVASIILSAILMMVSRSFYFKELIAAMFYPAFGVLIVGELYFYLDGATRREYLSDILGEDEESYKTVNYSLLRKFLRSIFGDKVIAENTTINNALSYDGTTQDIIDELSRSEDNKIVCFATYIDALNKTGTTIDHNYLRSSIDLLNGTSILFNNPFYNDLIPYAFYPMNRAILQHKKVLVVLGRHAIEDDIREWIEKGIGAVTNIPFMWNIGVLNSEPQDLDIGIVTRSDVLDLELHNANSEFLEKVGYVVIIEPSRLISTAQIGLNMLVKKCRATEDKEIVYCMCDKNCDGLVDAMSHILMTSITEVSATRKHLGTSSYMCWEADDEYWHHRLIPNISRYLGVGTELSFAALKNQVSKTKWYGGEAFPVTDLRWISQQYYYDLTRYASLPTTPDAMDEHFATTPNFWSAEVETNNYMTVEDESYNMFEILRDFSTRATEQGFINIISSDYLLKDYMADNASIFEADAKAIPYIVADYTRSNRNAILRLILKMSIFPVSVEVLEKELSLLGISVFDLKKQLWFELYNCYSTTAQLSDLPDDYRQAVNEVYGRAIKVGDSEWTPKMLKSKESFNLQLGKMETTYYISDSEFMNVCVAELRSAGYVSEDEKGQRYYLGAELAGHIYQKYLPGQFFTFGGKYYEMQYLTSDGQVLVRRAADHINGRPEYRQRRKYVITGTRQSDKIGAVQDVGGMKIVKEFADISVSTPGYYLMGKYNDFANARYVSFEESKTGIPDRSYRNKEILRIDLPDLDGKLTDNVRYTITLLFNEIFRTIFAENQAYICAVTDESFITEEGARPLTYSIEGNGYELHSRSIYIIEDSQLDLGLTVAVERNLQRILGIIFDYLDWHRETLEASLNQPPEPVPPVVFAEEAAEPEKPEKKKGFFRRIIDKIKGLFKRKKPEGPQIVEPAPENPTTPENPTAPETPEGGTTPMGNTPDEPKNPKDDEKPEEGGENPTEPTPADDNSADGEAGDEPTDDGQSDSENQPIDEPSDNNPEGESGIDAGTPDGEPKKMTRAEKRAAKKAEKKRKKEEKKQRKAEEKRKK
ncbi:MAG: hypothetical protein IKY44_05070, partial [Clostridia bacterium]|nr:hypothetical protein [Clostridia bacterium]